MGIGEVVRTFVCWYSFSSWNLTWHLSISLPRDVAMVHYPEMIWRFQLLQTFHHWSFWSSWCSFLFDTVGFHFWYKLLQIYVFLVDTDIEPVPNPNDDGWFIGFHVHKCLGPEDIPIKSSYSRQQRWSIWDVSVSCASSPFPLGILFFSSLSVSMMKVLTIQHHVFQKPGMLIRFSGLNFFSLWFFWTKNTFPTATDTNITDLLFHTCKAGRFGLFLRKKKGSWKLSNMFYWMISFMLFFLLYTESFVCLYRFTGETHHHFATTKEAEAVRSEGWEVGWRFGYTSHH